VMPQATAKRVALRHGACPDNVVAAADRLKVEQIVLNLLSNAVKFTPESGEIAISCRVTDDDALIDIRDSGPGIPAEKQDAIFEPFVQLGRTLTSAHEGTGLGLAISRDLARAMDGDVTVKSAIHEGSTFTLRLPAK